MSSSRCSGPTGRPASGRPGLASCWPTSTSATASIACRPSSRAASASGWRSPGPWPTNPKILLADEPTGSLDSASTARFLDLLERLSGEGMTIVMVTHDSDVAAHAHRIIEMRDGTVIAESITPRATEFPANGS